MKLLVKFILILSFSIGYSQVPNNNISNDFFLNFYYDRGEIILKDERLKTLDYVAENILNNKLFEEYSFRIETGTCENEKKGDSFIDFKRIEYLFDYFKNKYNLERNNFQFDISDSEFCYDDQNKNISYVNFAIQNCRVFSKYQNKIDKKISFKKNNVIPTSVGRKSLHEIAKVIKEDNIMDKYDLRIEIVISNKEKKDNPLLSYERINYLLNYFEIECDIKRNRIQFQFINNKQQNKVSFFRVILLDCG